jgi:uncharacterized RDD family membrane protein YckC
MDYTSMGFAPTGAFAPRVVYGGFWIRVAAYGLDALLVVIGQVIRSQLIAGSSQVSLLSGLIGWHYFAGMEALVGGTLGKLVLGLHMTDLAGQRISFLRATGRYFAKVLSALILLLGFVLVAVTTNKQGLHDKLAGTLVVKG